jgi:DNA primase
VVSIPDEDVARVRAATDIVALIGEHAALKRQGRRWVGLCPFHQEKTPSFSVNAEEGFYYCFGCQQSGDAITFVRVTEHLDFVDAVRRLAERSGITITEDPAATAERRVRARLTEAMEQAVTWYHERLLAAPDAGPARDYLRSRGYDGDVVRQFKLGWAPDDWDALASALSLGAKVLTDSGLGFVNRRGRQQDAFRARVIFPIFDSSDRPVALGGRILPPPEADVPTVGSDSDRAPAPKYKNSQDGPLYAKRRTLYALNWAKRDIISSGEVVVCEGYTDVIGCFQAGIPRAVATCGTALGEEHFRLVRNFAPRVVLAYDADAAGQAGAGRVYEWERQYAVDLHVASLPLGSDPGELARTNPDALRRAVADARPFLQFRVERTLQAGDLRSAEGRARAAEAAVVAIVEHPNDLVRDQYLMQVADRCRIEATTVRSLADRARRAAGSSPTSRSASGTGRPGASPSRPVGGVDQEEPADSALHGGEGALGTGTARLAPPSRAGLGGLRWAVHDPERVASHLDPVLFAPGLEREVFVSLAAAQTLQQAVERAEEETPALADLLRRLSVEEPAADADDVIVQLVRTASRRALGDLESRARLEPEAFSQLAAEIALVRDDLSDLDDRDHAVAASDRLLAWLVSRGEEGA